MIILQSADTWECGHVTYPPGGYYLENGAAASALLLNGHIVLGHVSNPKPFLPSQNWNDRDVLMVSAGGYGDLLFLTPVIRALKKKWPRMNLDMALNPVFADILIRHPSIRGVTEYPVPEEMLDLYDGVLWFEGIMEHDPRAATDHIVDLHASFAGVELADGRHCDYVLDPHAQERMRRRFPAGARPRVAVQVEANEKCRTYPPRLLYAAMIELTKHADVLMLGHPCAGMPPPPAGIRDMRQEEPHLGFAESVALMHDCDVVLAPDSSLCHIAGALKLPTVALFGSFDPALRTKYHPSIEPMFPAAPPACAPCMWNARKGPWPEKGPCFKSHQCEALAGIDPLDVVRKVCDMLPRIVG